MIVFYGVCPWVCTAAAVKQYGLLIFKDFDEIMLLPTL